MVCIGEHLQETVHHLVEGSAKTEAQTFDDSCASTAVASSLEDGAVRDRESSRDNWAKKPATRSAVMSSKLTRQGGKSNGEAQEAK